MQFIWENLGALKMLCWAEYFTQNSWLPKLLFNFIFPFEKNVDDTRKALGLFCNKSHNL